MSWTKTEELEFLEASDNLKMKEHQFIADWGETNDPQYRLAKFVEANKDTMREFHRKRALREVAIIEMNDRSLEAQEAAIALSRPRKP